MDEAECVIDQEIDDAQLARIRSAIDASPSASGGASAFAAGKKYSDNPYSRDTEDGQRWHEAFSKAWSMKMQSLVAGGIRTARNGGRRWQTFRDIK